MTFLSVVEFYNNTQIKVRFVVLFASPHVSGGKNNVKTAVLFLRVV
jgi:hypothetical protein|tara:strand:+ start:163 stop:300 length:138 start_codon:yes stop_codon:yes gene_type:complete